LTAQANNLYAREKYAQAEPLYKRVLSIKEKKKQGSKEADIVEAIRPLAVTLFEKRRSEWRDSLVEHAIEILEKSNQPEDLTAPLTFLNDLAGELRDQGNDDEAGLLYKRAEGIAEKHFGPDDSRLAEALTGQAGNFYARKKYAQAEPLYNRVLSIKEKKQGSKNADVVETIRPLAVTLF